MASPFWVTYHDFWHVVSEPTRGSATIDLVVTNHMHVAWLLNKPSILTPIDTSDHNLIVWRSKSGTSGARDKVKKTQAASFLSIWTRSLSHVVNSASVEHGQT